MTIASAGKDGSTGGLEALNAPAAMNRKALPASLRENLLRGRGTTSPLAIPAVSSPWTSHACTIYKHLVYQMGFIQFRYLQSRLCMLCRLQAIRQHSMKTCADQPTHLDNVGGVVGDSVQVNALEGNIAQHGAHAQRSSLQDVILSNLQQASVVCQTPDGRLCRIETHMTTTHTSGAQVQGAVQQQQQLRMILVFWWLIPTCNLSSARELRARWTPVPLVSRLTTSSKAHERESPIWSSLSVGKASSRNARLFAVPQVTKTWATAEFLSFTMQYSCKKNCPCIDAAVDSC